MSGLFTWVPTVVYSTLILLGYLATGALLITHDVPAESREFILVIWGNLNALTMTIVGKWLGRNNEAS